VAISDAGWRRRLVDYLASAKNLTGSALAIVGLALFFTGVVGGLWPIVVGGLYVVGALVAPRGKRVLGSPAFDARQLQKELGALVARVNGKLPDEVLTEVQQIATVIQQVLPRAGESLPGSEDLFILSRTIEDYLPKALDAYLALPPVYARSHVVRDGKTATDIILDELKTLDERMDQVADATARKDVDRLLAHGRFLEEKFGKDADLQLPPAPSADPETPAAS
jgi:hypothetical protein